MEGLKLVAVLFVICGTFQASLQDEVEEGCRKEAAESCTDPGCREDYTRRCVSGEAHPGPPFDGASDRAIAAVYAACREEQEQCMADTDVDTCMRECLLRAAPCAQRADTACTALDTEQKTDCMSTHLTSCLAELRSADDSDPRLTPPAGQSSFDSCLRVLGVMCAGLDAGIDKDACMDAQARQCRCASHASDVLECVRTDFKDADKCNQIIQDCVPKTGRGSDGSSGDGGGSDGSSGDGGGSDGSSGEPQPTPYTISISYARCMEGAQIGCKEAEKYGSDSERCLKVHERLCLCAEHGLDLIMTCDSYDIDDLDAEQRQKCQRVWEDCESGPHGGAVPDAVPEGGSGDGNVPGRTPGGAVPDAVPEGGSGDGNVPGRTPAGGQKTNDSAGLAAHSSAFVCLYVLVLTII